MSDNLGGIQRHSTDAYWKEYHLFVLAEYGAPRSLIQSLLNLCKEKGASVAPYEVHMAAPDLGPACSRHSVAVLIDVEHSHEMSKLVEECDIRVKGIHHITGPESGHRMMYDVDSKPLGFLVPDGKLMRWRKCAIKCLNTGEYFVPKLTGFLSAKGSTEVKINPMSTGARYRDHA